MIRNLKFKRFTDVLYELKVIVFDDKKRARYPQFKVRIGARYFLHSIEEAEEKIKEITHSSEYSWMQIYCFFVTELPYGIEICSPYNVDNYSQYTRSYLADGNFWADSIVSSFYNDGLEPFYGRSKELCKFVERDIVEVFDGSFVTLEIVAQQPPTIEMFQMIINRCSEQERKIVPYPWDYSDDSYITLDGDRDYMYNHSHPASITLFPPSMKVPEWAKKRLYNGYDKLNEDGETLE